MPFKISLFTVSMLFLTIAAVGGARAEDPQALGTFKDWSAYKMTEGGQVVCFAVTSPEERLPLNVNHGDVFVLVTNWVTRQVSGELSVVTGYNFKEESTVTIEVGSSKWQMFTNAQGAWLRTQDEDRKLLQAMKRGSSMRIKGTSARGTATEYSVSLSGITAATNKIDADCR